MDGNRTHQGRFSALLNDFEDRLLAEVKEEISRAPHNEGLDVGECWTWRLPGPEQAGSS